MMAIKNMTDIHHGSIIPDILDDFLNLKKIKLIPENLIFP